MASQRFQRIRLAVLATACAAASIVALGQPSPTHAVCGLTVGAGTSLQGWDYPTTTVLANSFTVVGPTGGTSPSGLLVPASTLRNVYTTDCTNGDNVFADTDVDGLPDLVELTPYLDGLGGAGTFSPIDPDTDNDGVNDYEEAFFRTNPNNKDTDGDGPGGGSGTRTDAVDNCPLVANATQADADGDAFGDGCDTYTPPGGGNADGDGIAAIKSTAAGTRGVAGLSNYAFGTNSGCSAGEEATHGTSDTNPRDFPDVDANGVMSVADVAHVKQGFGSVAGDTTGRYKRAMDVDPASPSGGRGSGFVDLIDLATVKAFFGQTCAAAP